MEINKINKDTVELVRRRQVSRREIEEEIEMVEKRLADLNAQLDVLK